MLIRLKIVVLLLLLFILGYSWLITTYHYSIHAM